MDNSELHAWLIKSQVDINEELKRIDGLLKSVLENQLDMCQAVGKLVG